jgi:hypothetical protein
LRRKIIPEEMRSNDRGSSKRDLKTRIVGLRNDFMDRTLTSKDYQDMTGRV